MYRRPVPPYVCAVTAAALGTHYGAISGMFILASCRAMQVLATPCQVCTHKEALTPGLDYALFANGRFHGTELYKGKWYYCVATWRHGQLKLSRTLYIKQ
jgi:hypothetical protein